MNLRTVDDVIQNLVSPSVIRLEAPKFEPSENVRKVVLGVESMKDHMTDEGFQITHGLSLNGYTHCGYKLHLPITRVPDIVERTHPGTMVVQDIREWGLKGDAFREMNARFTEIECLQSHPEIFRLTVLKDAHQDPKYHSNAAVNMGCHAWIVYYHPRIVAHLATYSRMEHYVRTHHSVDPSVVPKFSFKDRSRCLLSGAVSGAYPLRSRILNHSLYLGLDVLPHPGYHRSGTHTPDFFKVISKYKVHICTSSRYGYSLRKIVESAAAGCRVITDLPVDDVMPEIDSNLIRIPPDIAISDLREVVKEAVSTYNPEMQYEVAQRALKFYDYIEVGRRLADDIETLRKNYNGRSISTGHAFQY